MRKKVTPVGSCLSTLLEDSTRMLPFMATFFYNLESRLSCSQYLRHLVSTLTNGSRSKKCFILCLENSFDPQRFIRLNKIDLNSNIVVLQDMKIDLTLFDSLSSLFLGSKADNILIIDSLIPLLMTSNEEYDKTIYKVITALKKLQPLFSYMTILHSTDVFIYDKSLEISLKQISNTILDFRRESGIDSGVTCQLHDSSIHVHIIVKKKHPRTHLKVSSQHEHFEIKDHKIVKYLSGSQVAKNITSKLDLETNLQPESVIEKLVPFSLSLRECEQKAKDDLVLPYMRKQGSEKDAGETKSTGGGQVIYHYDKFDDFDEDDPDDDLDF